MEREYISNSENETLIIGKMISKILKKGDIVCLTGDLGTGKTVLVRGIARGLGISGYITSPTFNIVNTYTARACVLHHFDVYRVYGEEELFEIGFEEYFDNDAIVVIEWAELVRGLLPKPAIWINIKREEKNIEKRKIMVTKEE